MPCIEAPEGHQWLACVSSLTDDKVRLCPTPGPCRFLFKVPAVSASAGHSCPRGRAQTLDWAARVQSQLFEHRLGPLLSFLSCKMGIGVPACKDGCGPKGDTTFHWF